MLLWPAPQPAQRPGAGDPGTGRRTWGMLMSVVALWHVLGWTRLDGPWIGQLRCKHARRWRPRWLYGHECGHCPADAVLSCVLCDSGAWAPQDCRSCYQGFLAEHLPVLLSGRLAALDVHTGA